MITTAPSLIDSIYLMIMWFFSVAAAFTVGTAWNCMMRRNPPDYDQDN